MTEQKFLCKRNADGSLALDPVLCPIYLTASLTDTLAILDHPQDPPQAGANTASPQK